MAKWTFTFTNDNEWELGSDKVDQLIEVLDVGSFENLLALVPGGDREFSDDAIVEKYPALDKKLLPKIWIEIFTDNFSDADKLFSEKPDMLVEDASKKGGKFEEAKIILLEMSGEQSSLNVRLMVESKFAINIKDGIDLEDEHSDENQESGMSDQIYECKNMCNFGFNGIDLENDEPLSHNWEAAKQ